MFNKLVNTIKKLIESEYFKGWFIVFRKFLSPNLTFIH